MAPRDKSVRRTEQRIYDLIAAFDEYCDAFDTANLFTGPSLYFHLKTLSLLRQHISPSEALLDQVYLESLYATLTAWGMHRMGPSGAKLVDFAEMTDSFRQLRQQIESLAAVEVCHLGAGEVETTALRIWEIISALKVGMGETRIVSGSKALHHVLPALVPPIDREYTIRFFLHSKTLYQGDETAFLDIFPHFHQIATQCRANIQARIGGRMNSSPTKVIDNAIVGYVRSRLRDSA